MVTGTRMADEAEHVRRLLDGQQLAWDASGRRLVPATLDATPDYGKPADAAKVWGQTIAGLTGASGALALIQGDAQIGSLVDADKGWAVWPLLVAFGLALLAIVLAFLAAYARKPWGMESGTALNLSVGAALAATVLAGFAAYRVWSGQLEPLAPTAYLVRYSNGRVDCHFLAREGGRLVLANGGALEGVASIEAAAGCP